MLFVRKHDFSGLVALWQQVFSCDQAALWMVQSVCLSVCLSVRPSHLFHHVPSIVSSWNFQELLPWTEVMSMQKLKVRGQRSRSQRSTPNLAVSGLLTSAWIHIWQWNHAHSWKQHRRGALLFFNVISQISRSHSSKNRWIVCFRNSSLNSPIATKWCTKLEVA